MTETEASQDGTARTDDSGGEAGRYSQQHGDAATTSTDDRDGGAVRVLDPQTAEGLRGRWNEVQAGFVDEPKESVNGADQLVGEVLDEVSRVFREQRSELENTWSGGDSERGTEELRQALRRYREFFDRLLSL